MANEVIRGLPAQRGGGTRRLSEEGARSQATGPAASQFFGNGWLDGVAFRQNESIFL